MKADEIEAKFLVLDPGKPISPDAKRIRITQTYLRTSDPLIERRIRKWEEDGKTAYFFTQKAPTEEPGRRDELEVKIPWLAYWIYMIFLRDRSLTFNPFVKVRHIYPHGEWKCQHDVYEGELVLSGPFEVIEIEVSKMADLKRVSVPSYYETIKVTGDKQYSNRAIAEHGIPQLKGGERLS